MQHPLHTFEPTKKNIPSNRIENEMPSERKITVDSKSSTHTQSSSNNNKKTKPSSQPDVFLIEWW